VSDDTNRVVRGLGMLAGALGLLAAVAGSPYAAQHGRIDVDALARAVSHEDDHVTAIELAGWIKERRADVRVIDIRSRDDYESFHIPTAERVPIESLSVTPFRAGETIVLYSDGGAHAAQAWVFLRALGHDKVYFLRGGLYEWLDQIMSPGLQVNASAKDSAAFGPIADLSRYFGGIPRFGVPASGEAIPLPAAKADSPRSTTSLVLRVRRRGC
jgi:rhodanese-related sulfurtransferase